jgi:hypothetical protein
VPEQLVFLAEIHVAVLSGGNVDPALFAEVLTGA